MSEVSLRSPLDRNSKPDDALVRTYEKAYRKLKEDIINEDKDTYTHQGEKLKEFLQHLEEIRQKAAANKQECSKKINKLRTESQVYEQKVASYDQNFKLTNKQAEYKNSIAVEEEKYVASCKRRIEIANSINYKLLTKIDIEERSSAANEPFKWILTAIYGEPQSKYYWPNFLEQALELDKGEDLRERLGKVNAFNAKEDQRVKTVAFLASYDLAVKAVELKDHTEEIRKINEIAKLFLTSIDIGRKVREFQDLIEASKKEFQKGEQENQQVKNTLETYRERIRVSEIYLNQLTKIQKLAESKVQNYNEKIVEGTNYLKEISSLDLKVYPTTFVAAENEKRDNCECTIM